VRYVFTKVYKYVLYFSRNGEELERPMSSCGLCRADDDDDDSDNKYVFVDDDDKYLFIRYLESVT
jgi:hypothetical protein